ASRHLVGSKSVAYEALEFSAQPGGVITCVPQHHEGAGDLARSVVGYSDHAAVLDGRVFEQDRLDLRRGHGEALVLDQFFAAVDDAEEAAPIASADVPGPIPTIAQSLSRSLGSVPIAEHELRTAHDELARLTVVCLASVARDHA